jgi:beta-catenin-like protein 1
MEEEEMVENLFDALCACLQCEENKELFRNSEGIQLMILMIK